ncbi:MAG: hypothetical protein Ta2F_05640 [Termitinemataceae bacterium]|nr:MAG: hypothetical protein Ta2F_05640 [Termitinemataceae bacterium]
MKARKFSRWKYIKIVDLIPRKIKNEIKQVREVTLNQNNFISGFFLKKLFSGINYIIITKSEIIYRNEYCASMIKRNDIIHIEKNASIQIKNIFGFVYEETFKDLELNANVTMCLYDDLHNN